MGPRFGVSQRIVGLVALIFLSLFPLAGRSIAGHEEAGIIGRATDESGGVLPGITITATSPAFQLPQMTDVTNERASIT